VVAAYEEEGKKGKAKDWYKTEEKGHKDRWASSSSTSGKWPQGQNYASWAEIVGTYEEKG